ncbi:MAG: hypothetical protein RL885_25495 [Planctomycetota bacterium]
MDAPAPTANEQISNRISLVSIVSACVLFALPWIELRCSGSSVATQSGFQAAIGEASLSDRLAQQRESTSVSASNDNGPEMAAGILAGGLLLLAALGFSIHALSGQRQSSRIAVLFTTLSLVSIAGQAIWGFPVETGLEEAMNEAKTESGVADSPIAASLAAAIDFECRYTPWFYIELILLGLPLLLLFILRPVRRSP